MKNLLCLNSAEHEISNGHKYIKYQDVKLCRLREAFIAIFPFGILTFMSRKKIISN